MIKKLLIIFLNILFCGVLMAQVTDDEAIDLYRADEYGDKTFKSLPYTANKDGGYTWVDVNKGFVSCAVWYIFAKNEFNPLKLQEREAN